MDSSKYIFNYLTTNNITGKQYVGMHITINPSDNYIGSGHLLVQAVKKYGKENFTRDIICFCSDVSTAFYNERIFISEFNTLTPNGYNISPFGGMNGKGSMDDETKNKIKKTLKGRKGKPSKYKGISRTEEIKEKIKKSNLGKKRSKKVRKKLSEGRLGKKLVNNKFVSFDDYLSYLNA
jgi:group I intron endonuclease